MMNHASGDLSTPAWASALDADVARAVGQHDTVFLARAVETETGRMSHPWLDHHLPLLYAAGAADERDEVRFPVVGFDLGSLSMRSVLFGSTIRRRAPAVRSAALAGLCPTIWPDRADR
jgi:4,5-DOPA dioxygenase extradiol